MRLLAQLLGAAALAVLWLVLWAAPTNAASSSAPLSLDEQTSRTTAANSAATTSPTPTSTPTGVAPETGSDANSNTENEDEDQLRIDDLERRVNDLHDLVELMLAPIAILISVLALGGVLGVTQLERIAGELRAIEGYLVLQDIKKTVLRIKQLADDATPQGQPS